MPSYDLDIPEVGLVHVTKRRGQRSVRIRLGVKGEVTVSTALSVPKIVVKNYVTSKKDWINKHRSDYSFTVYDGMRFGQDLYLELRENRSKNHSKFDGRVLKINLDSIFDETDTKQQKYIESKLISAMKDEAEAVLLPRLQTLAEMTDHEFNQAFVKNLKSRWGSCDAHKNIILNIFLLQIPSELQDYVMLHELTHTKYLNHSANFWSHLEKYLPSYKQLRKNLKNHHPRLEQVEL